MPTFEVSQRKDRDLWLFPTRHRSHKARAYSFRLGQKPALRTNLACATVGQHAFFHSSLTGRGLQSFNTLSILYDSCWDVSCYHSAYTFKKADWDLVELEGRFLRKVTREQQTGTCHINCAYVSSTCKPIALYPGCILHPFACAGS